MKKIVYLAGPIEGCTNHEINQWRQKCYTGFNDFIVGVNPYRAEREADDPEARKRIVMKNYIFVDLTQRQIRSYLKHKSAATRPRLKYETTWNDESGTRSLRDENPNQHRPAGRRIPV